MQVMWTSLRENINCCKLTDALNWPEKPIAKRCCNYGIMLREFIELESPMHKPVLMHSNARNWFCGKPNWFNKFNELFQYNLIKQFLDLEIGVPSRNVVEMIFQAAATHPRKQTGKIKKVLRVNSSKEILERFEKYREFVKKKSICEQLKRHPRITVDGNELLQFYNTTMTCCSRRKRHNNNNNGVSELCKDSNCRVCRIIQSGFDTSYNRRYGIRLSTSSEELSEDMNTCRKGKNAKRAVIICRTIAGRVANMFNGDYEEEYDSIKSGFNSKIEYLVVQNPSAVLPCFVIVFN